MSSPFQVLPVLPRVLGHCSLCVPKSFRLRRLFDYVGPYPKPLADGPGLPRDPPSEYAINVSYVSFFTSLTDVKVAGVMRERYGDKSSSCWSTV